MVERHKRRAFLSTVISGTAIGIAGCSSDDGTSNGGDTGGDGGDSNNDGSDGDDTSEGSDGTDEGNEDSDESTGGPPGVVGQFQVDAANTGFVPDASVQSGLSVDWQYPEEPAVTLAGLTYGGGQLYTVFRAESGEQRLVALDPTTGELVNERSLSLTTNMPVYRNGTLYVDGAPRRTRTVLALSPDDFSEQWNSPTRLGGSEMTATDDAIYGFSLSGGSDVVRSISTDDGALRWEQEVAVGGFTSEQPVAVGDEHVFAAGDGLNALARSDGTQQWSATTDGAFTSPPLVAEGTVYVGTENGVVKGYNTADGTETLSVDSPASFDLEDPFAYADGRLFGLGSFSVFAIDVGPGSVVWQGDPGLSSAVTIAGDHLLGVRVSGQRVIGLNRSDGTIALEAGPDGGNEALVGGSWIFAVGERVYAGYNGRVIALS